ncbi:MAG: TonB-dependent receptor plug domain-containing protein [Kofleriaceae bacterium]
MRSAGTLFAAICLWSSVVHADVPVVDPADLPPLPDASDDESSNAAILAAVTAEEDVVVGAAKREQSLGNVASAVTVITADRIKRFGYRTVGEAVASVAGAYFEDTRIVATIGFRGINILGDFNTRILVLVDGASVNEGWGSFAGVGYGELVAIDDIARIEVIRGPVSSVYGTNAFFGIINIVTRGATETPRAWGRVGLNSINGAIASAGFSQGTVRQQIRGTVQTMWRLPETLSVPEVGDNLKGDASNLVAGSVVGTYNGTFAQVRAYRFRRDSPFAPYNGDPGASNPYNEYNSQLLVEGGHTEELSKHLTIAGRAYYNMYEFFDHIAQYGLDPFEDFGDATTVGVELRGRYEAIPELLGITAGTEGNFNRTRSRSYTVGGADEVDVPKDFNIEGLYTELDGNLTPWLGYTAGARYDRNSAIDTKLSPRAALFISKPEKYGVKFLYAEGFRNPSAYEAFFYDNVTFAPADQLRSETIRSYELVGWAKPIGGLSTRISAYYWDARGIVEQLPVPNPTPAQVNLISFQNVGRIVTEGVEVEASYRNSGGWYAFGGGAYSRVGSSDTGGALSYAVVNAPAVTAAGGVSTPKLFGLGHLSTELTYISDRLTRPQMDGSASPDSPAWYGLNAVLYLPDVRGFDVTAGVRNIIGTRDLMPAPADYDRYMVPTTTTVARIPGEGRELFLKLGYSY